ncbi:hypothetical protein ABT364_20935 [Massilia sp. SR12]
MQLPAMLRPWVDWLSLFPPDLAKTMGELLLRLNPLLTPLQRHAARVAVDPAGVGDIVMRGSYDRLLISEWAYADAVPDEFLRRAANGELLFSGPEPANSNEPLSSVALFDAGPFQLGEPRLVHLAMFILLSRRAEMAGAAFKWGILQRPDVLFTVQGMEALQHLLNVRTFVALDDTGLAAWENALGDGVSDCWLVGDARSPRPAQIRSLVTTRRAWLSNQLDVTLAQRRGSTTVALAMPVPADGVRLLRKPFEAQVAPTVMQTAAAGAHSLKQAPHFGTIRQWLAVAMVDGSITLYHVPDSPNVQPGRPRKISGSKQASTRVALGLVGKSMGTVSRFGQELYFSNFPGTFFNAAYPAAPEPLSELVNLMPGAARPVQAFHLQHRVDAMTATERVLVLDRMGVLVSWMRTGNPGGKVPPATISLVANHVIGAYQTSRCLLFAVAKDGRTDIYELGPGDVVKKHVMPLMHKGGRFLFGSVDHWRDGGGLYALEIEVGNWLVGDRSGGAHIMAGEGVEVLGVGFSQAAGLQGLVVLSPSRTRIELIGANQRRTLVESTEKIAKASYDPVRNRLAWLGFKSGSLTVRGIDQEKPVLQTISAGANNGN